MSAEYELDPGTAGASAEREHERRGESRERNSIANPRGLAGVARALWGPSADETRRAARVEAWATGARGEQLVAESLARRCPEVPVLHDRRMPGSRANIDHLAVAASGVYVIDAKRYRGKIEIRSSVLGKRALKIAGRDQTRLVEGLSKQVAAVETVLAQLAPDVPVTGCFCFVAPDGLLADSGLPLVRTLSIDGYPLFYPRTLASRLNGPGRVAAERARTLAAQLAERFPPA